MPNRVDRRAFVRQAGAIGAATVAGLGGQMAQAQAGAQEMPTIRLGDVEVSRLILGSNPFYGFSHKPDDTAERMRQYYTEERIMQVLDEAADHGITAVWTPCYDHWIKLWTRYQGQGGKLKIWIGQPDAQPDQMKAAISACADNGGRAVCIQGVAIDARVGAGKWDTVADWVSHIHDLGLPAGIASHSPQTHLTAEARGLPTEFYHQCTYQPENYDESCRDQALATIEQMDKPVVAFKVLAAGRLDPATALPTVMGRLKPKDGLCVGVFPETEPGQVAEIAGLVRTLSAA